MRLKISQPTLALWGVEQAEKTANNLLQEALDEIKNLDERAENLRAISEYMVTRNS